MAVEDGLLVPVVKFADQKALSGISAEVKEFAGKAKEKKISLEERFKAYFYNFKSWNVWD